MTTHFRIVLLGASGLALASCGAVKDTTTAGLTKASQFSIRDLMPSRVKVVEVRQKDMKEVPLGKERALAFQNEKNQMARQSRGGFFGFFRGPVDFKEPDLPGAGGEMDGGLLPPRAN